MISSSNSFSSQGGNQSSGIRTPSCFPVASIAYLPPANLCARSLWRTPAEVPSARSRSDIGDESELSGKTYGPAIFAPPSRSIPHRGIEAGPPECWRERAHSFPAVQCEKNPPEWRELNHVPPCA